MKIFIILFLLPLCSFPQNNYVFQHLTVEDGLLPNPRVNTFQDAEGFYWFSSATGIQRFDGKNFNTYSFSNKAMQTNAKRDEEKPVQDKEQNIWILNGDGINIYNRKQRIITRLYMNDAPDSNISNVCNLIKDEKDNIWIITTKNIYLYNYTSAKPVLFSSIVTEPAGIKSAAYNFKRKEFWLLISRNNGYEIACFDYHKKLLSYPVNAAVKKTLKFYSPVAFFNADESDNLWITDFHGNLCRYNTIRNELFNYSFLHEADKIKKISPNSVIHESLDDGNGTIWFGGDNIGLIKYNKKSDSFAIISHENGSEYGLHYDQLVYGFFKDREGNIWMDTDLGMNIFNPNLQQFKYLDQGADMPQQFSANITSIFESSTKNIWISTWGNGVFKYDSNFVLQKNYVHDKNNPASFGEPMNRAWSIGEDKKKRIWIGSQYGMLSRLNQVSGKFLNEELPVFEHRTIMHIAGDKKNNLWFGLYNGILGKWNAESDKIIVYKNLYGSDPNSLTVVDGLFVDEKNLVWIATSMFGLNCYNADKSVMDRKAQFPHQIYTPFPLNDSVIIGGTLGKGFFMFNKLRNSVEFFNTASGLSSDKAFGGVADKANNIWIFASNGIERLNLSSRTIFHYDLNDGIKDHVFSRAFCGLKNGLLMVAANSGVIIFNPDSIKIKPPPPDVLITGFSADQQNFSVDSLLQNKTISLSHDQNVIMVEYASVSFTGRRTDQYFYQLKGIDRNWVAAGTHRSVTYANLSPGNYIFNVRSQNSGGIKSAHITAVSFTIHPPWWLTWWAYLLWFILLSAVSYEAYDYRKRSRRALSAIRLGIAKDLHDDIGSTLNSISVYSEIAGRQFETNAENAKSLLEKMGSTSRNMIDTMNDIVWAVNPKNDYFENILQRMQYFAGELLSGRNILLQFDADKNIKALKLPMAKRKNFYLIFKEAVNNIYKHAGCTSVNVSIAQQTHYIVMIITDDGAGFDSANALPAGNGLKNMQARAREINARLYITSLLMKGTRIELRVPFKKN